MTGSTGLLRDATIDIGEIDIEPAGRSGIRRATGISWSLLCSNLNFERGAVVKSRISFLIPLNCRPQVQIHPVERVGVALELIVQILKPSEDVLMLGSFATFAA